MHARAHTHTHTQTHTHTHTHTSAQEAVIHSYITGMLTNFKALPLDRIHNMLKMFVTDPPYTKKITVRAYTPCMCARVCARERARSRDGFF